jgi:hypothetical protein
VPIQCDADLLKPCDPLIYDASDSVADALIADAENNGRMISCQLAQRALADCLCKLERGGIVKPREGVQSVCPEQPRGASPAPADRARGPPRPARGAGPAE